MKGSLCIGWGRRSDGLAGLGCKKGVKEKGEKGVNTANELISKRM
jgi:hypothetical protein